MLFEVGVVVEPPERRARKHYVAGALGAKLLELRDRLGAVAGMMADVTAVAVSRSRPMA